MLTFDLNLKALEADLDKLGDKAMKAARLGARVGSEIYYQAVLATVPVSKKGHWFHGTSFKTSGQKYWFESGSLKSSVYQVFAKESTPKHPEYQIAWNHRKVPYGFMVTFGTATGSAPNKFISRAENTVHNRAVLAMTDKFKQVMNER